MKIKAAALAVIVLGACVAPASAQIIATSVPRADTGGGTAGGEKKFAFHILASPFAKWNISSFDNTVEGELYTISAKPNSKFLIAAEAAFALSPNVSLGLGGWYNKVGQKPFAFGLQFQDNNALSGTLDSDLTFWEGHASFFYKDIGVQAGLVHLKGSFTNYKAVKYTQPGQPDFLFADLEKIGSPAAKQLIADINQNLTDSFSADFSTTDVDAFLVYKTGSARFNPKTNMPWTISLGAGIYHYKDANTVFSGYVTGSLSVFKGVGVDVSYWYIGKSTLSRDIGASDAMSRFLVGVGYTFSK